MLASDEAVQNARLDVQAALGNIPADLLLRDCQLVNVWSEETYTTDVAIRGTRIVALRQNYSGTAGTVVECAGRFALPGFVEPIAEILDGMGLDVLARTLLPHGVTSVVLPDGFAAFGNASSLQAASPLRIWQRVGGRTGWGNGFGKARQLQPERVCASIGDVVDAIEQGIAAVLDAGLDQSRRDALLRAIAEGHVETRHLILRHCCPSEGPAASFAITPMLVAATSAGIPLHRAIQMMGFNAATHYGVDHEVGSITPGRKADILLYEDLSRAQPACVIVDGKIHAPTGDFGGGL